MRRKELSDSAGFAFTPESAQQSAPHQPPHHHGHRGRLRERFFKNGAEQLADYEVLELLLFGVIPRQDTKGIAKALLAKFGTFGEVLAADPEDLKSVAGVKDAVATLLKAVQASVQLALQT